MSEKVDSAEVNMDSAQAQRMQDCSKVFNAALDTRDIDLMIYALERYSVSIVLRPTELIQKEAQPTEEAEAVEVIDQQPEIHPDVEAV